MNESTIQKIVGSIGVACAVERDKYVAVQEDLPEGWTISSTLTYFGLGVFSQGTKTAPVLSPEETQERFAVL